MLADLRNSTAFSGFAALLPFVPTPALRRRQRVWSTSRMTQITDSRSTQRKKKLLQYHCVHHKPYFELTSDL